jgi:hypothetical protein
LVDQIKKKGMGGAYSTYGRKKCIQVLVETPEGKRPLRGSRRGLGRGDIRIDVQEIGWEVCTGYLWLRIRAGGSRL